MQDGSQITPHKTEDMHILRVGWHSRANLLPLLYPLEAGWVLPPSPWKLEMQSATPGELLSALRAGDLDAAFVPSLAVLLHDRELSTLGGWGLAAEGATGTALLLAPQRLDLMDGGDLSILPEAADSTAEHLVKTLLTPYYGIKLNSYRAGAAGFNPEGARLMFGDAAALDSRKRASAWVAEDLGVAWFVLTGLPMVWEMLALSKSLEQRKAGAGVILQTVLAQSQRAAREQAATVLEEASTRLGLSKEATKSLLARQRFNLTESDMKALGRFLEMAGRAGVVY